MNTHRIASLLSIASFFVIISLAAEAQDARRIVEILEEEAPEEAGPETASGEDERPGSDAPQPLFYLRDQSKVAGMPELEALRVRTRYGVLSIPRDDLVQVRFVPRIDPRLKERIAGEIARLGDDDFDVREDAMERLREIGIPALPLLRAATGSPVEEIKVRSEVLVDELAARQEKEAGKYEENPGLQGNDDEIVTRRMTIRGTVEVEKIAIESRYGVLVVDVADIKEVAFRRLGPSVIDVDIHPKYQPPGNWLDTKLDLEKNQRLTIEATGNISVSNYGVSSGPAGTTQWSGNSFNNMPMLALIGKIGKKGQPFVVGNEHKGRVPRGGRLYLAIVPFSYNPGGAAGKYEAKVRVASGR